MAFSKSFRQLSRRLEIRSGQLITGVQVKVRRAAIKTDQTVVVGTPVDTGRAKSNWLVSLGTPVFEENEAFTPGEKGSTQFANEQAAIAQGIGVIGQWSIFRGSIFITNSLPYIQSLEEGSSAQSPAGMVKRAVQAGSLAFKAGRVFKV